jgi:paraquat-inducible protein B
LRPTALQDGQAFVLYSSLDEARKPKLNPTLPYLLLFAGSVRGLSSEASVEFRGIRLGTVVGASFKYFPGDPEHRVPVLIKIDPISFWIKLTATLMPLTHRLLSRKAWKKVFAPA